MASFSSTYPAQRPIFSLDAANAGRLDPRMTFSRSDTPPTYAAPSAVHYWSNEKHLSSENLLLHSSDFVTSWSGPGLSDRNTGQADPVGGTNATELVESGTADFHRVYQSVSATGDLALTVYAKRSSGSRYLNLAIMSSAAGPNGAGLATFDLSGGATHTSNGSSSTLTNLSATQTASGNGYYKCVFKATASAAAVTVYVSLSDSATPVANNYGMVYYTGDGTSSIDVAFASLSTTGATDYNATTTQIHRQYAPTLKSVATAGQPRFEYDPSTDGQSIAKGILIEGQATNLNPNSDYVGWNGSVSPNVTIQQNVAVAPNGQLTAGKLTPNDGVTESAYATVTISATSGQAYTHSFYAKGDGQRYVAIYGRTTNGVFAGELAHFDLQTGTVASTSGSGITASMQSAGNGWYRCIATITAAASSTGYFRVYVTDGSSFGVTGNGYGGIMLAHSQIESGNFASSLVSTSGASATRAAESLSVTDSSLFDNGGGSMVIESENVGRTYIAAVLSDASSGNYKDWVSIIPQSNNTVRQAVNAPDITSSSSLYSAASGGGNYFKIASRFAPNDFAVCIDGGSVSTDTTGAIPSNVDKLSIGWYQDGARADAHIKRVAIYSEPLSDANLVSLTS